MKKENDSLKQGCLIKDEDGQNWKVCSEEDNNSLYKYKTVDVSTLKTKSNTYVAIQKFIDAGIKTNIHFIYSKITHNRAIDMLKGKDVWEGKVDINKLTAVIFLLFKPQGSGKDLDWIPTTSQLQEFSKLIFKPKSKFMVGIDSCLVNHILRYEKPNKIQAISIDTCEGARQSAYITPDMKMMPCSFADQSKFAVDITEKQDIYNIWNHSSIFKKFREDLFVSPTKCPLF